MTALSRFARRVWYLLNRRRFERDLEREMAGHLAQMGDPARFGNAIRVREQNADVWGWTWIDDLARDLRYGARQLFIAPRVTFAAVCILALGAGVPLSILHIANALGRYMYAVPEPTTLVRIAKQSPNISTRMPVAAAEFYIEHSTVFAFLVGENRGWRVSIDDDPEPLPAVFVSSEYFENLGVVPQQGRLLDAADSAPSAEPGAMLGEAYWRRRFGADPSVVGRVVRVNGTPVRVVGITPRTFDGLASPSTTFTAVWLPLAKRPEIIEKSPALEDVTRADTELYGRLASGTMSSAAGTQLDTLTRDLQARHGGRVAVADTLRVVPLMRGWRWEADVAALFLLFFLIFFSACANLGNMLLERSLGRAREIEMRLALGATRWRVVRQLLTENVVLALLGCGVATAAGYIGARLIIRFLKDVPPGLHVALDGRMLFASFVMVLLAVAGFGLTPAIRAVRRRGTPTRARQTLVAVQVAASCVLLIVGTLLTRSVDRLRAVAPSLDYERTIVLDPQLNVRTLTSDAQRAMLDDISARVLRLPGVDAAALGASGRFVLGSPALLFHEVAPSYFGTVKLPIVRGRTFQPDEHDAIVVSRSAAHAVWPGQDPLGQKWTSGRGRVFVVVGVVEDSGLAARQKVIGEAYMPLSNDNLSRAVVFAHTIGDPRSLLRQARLAAAPAGLTSTATMMAETLYLEPRVQMGGLLSILGSIASLLAFTGIFTLVGFAVVQRTREIGVRMALGARRGDVLLTLLSQYATPLLAGSATGVALAVGVAQVLRNQLHGLSPLDPISHITGLAGFALVALVAVLLPARRALRIDPASALRWE